MSIELKEWLNSINHSKKNIMITDEDEKEYVPFVINKCMSAHIDSLFQANEMNLYWGLDKKLQYDYYVNVIRKKKRFAPWLKYKPDSRISLIKEYYNYSDRKAREVLDLITPEQFEHIEKSLYKGGKC
jgi:hypothetical protein